MRRDNLKIQLLTQENDVLSLLGTKLLRYLTVPVKALEATFALFLMGKFCRTAMEMAWLCLEFPEL